MTNAEHYQVEQLPCTQHAQNQGKITTTSDDIVMKQDTTCQDNKTHNAPLGPTLRELTFRPDHGEISRYPRLEAQDKTELQFLIACSLLNPDGSRWIQLGLHGDRISLRGAKEDSDVSKCWKPHLNCTLSAPSNEEDENLAILSFGILLMEIEAGRVTPRIEPGGDRLCNTLSLRGILSRILQEWVGAVEDSYRSITNACHHFGEDVETFYDPSIDGRTRRTGAIYKNIVASLFRLASQRFSNSLQRMNGFPLSAKSYPASKNNTSPSSRPVTNAACFDGSGPTSPTRQ